MSFKKSKIKLAETGQFSKLIIDYINGDKSLRPFYTYEPKIESFKKVIEDKSKENINREILVEVLKKQYARTFNFELSTLNLNVLLKKNTFTVCTGHQLCLFTGPLYFIYKIISTINLAETLKKQYPDFNFVPVYWMASEDHDFEEVSSINLFGKKVIWDNPEAKGAVGRLKTGSLKVVIEELKQILGDSENAKELIQLFNDAYLKHTVFADATRFFVHQLFGEYGLVIIDADDARLKSEFSDILKDDILNNTNYKIVNQTNSELEKIGVKPQVNPREINCFYLTNEFRERISKFPFEGGKGDEFGVQNTTLHFSSDKLVEELQSYPERFSPNVVLRPLYQQKILPNLAYVGGPGEIAYWLEYKAIFDHHKITFPVLIPRNFALLNDEKTNQQIQKLGFTISDVFKNTNVLLKEFVSKNSTSGLSLKEQEGKLIALFAEISVKAIAVDPTLKGSVEAELQKAINAIKNLESKLVRSEKQKQEVNINQIKKIKDKYFPNGELQERFENFSPYYLKYGKQFIADLKGTFDPLTFELLTLEI